MLLTNKSIEEKAIEIYQQSLKNPRIPEDHCAGVYELFIKRMKSHKEKNPHTREVTPGFVAKMVHYIIRELRKNNRVLEGKEEVQSLIRQALYDELEQRENSKAQKTLLNKITGFIKQSAETKESYRQYSSLFLLYYSYYLPLDYIMEMWQYLGKPVQNLEEQIRVIREKAIERSSRKIHLNEKELNNTYTRILQSHYEMKKAHTKEERLEIYKKCRALHFVQKSALIKKRAIEILPTISQLMEITAYGKDKITYALRVFCKGLRNNGINRKAIRRSA